jgi:hypothetical protein
MSFPQMRCGKLRKGVENFVGSVEKPYLTSFFSSCLLSLPVESFSKILSSPFCKKCRFLRFAQKSQEGDFYG